MSPKFSWEWRVAGYLGQYPKFDQIFILIASLRALVPQEEKKTFSESTM